MAENKHQQYSYHEMSNKVERADRSLLRSRAHEPTGEVESLRGKTDVGRMGDRLAGEKNARSQDLHEKMQQKKQKRGDHINAEGRRTGTKDNVMISSGGQTILDFENLSGYQPTTQTARAAYEKILVRVWLFRVSPPTETSFIAPFSHHVDVRLFVSDFYRIQVAVGKSSVFGLERRRRRGHSNLERPKSERSRPS
jgi:hypothetical protein